MKKRFAFTEEDITHRCRKSDLLALSLGFQVGLCSRLEEMVTRRAPTGEILHVLSQHTKTCLLWIEELQYYPREAEEQKPEEPKPEDEP